MIDNEQHKTKIKTTVTARRQKKIETVTNFSPHLDGTSDSEIEIEIEIRATERDKNNQTKKQILSLMLH